MNRCKNFFGPQRRILHGPRISISVTSDDTFINAVPFLGCRKSGIALVACFLKRQLLRIYLKNESPEPFEISTKNTLFFFHTSETKREELITEERHYESNILKEGWERCFTFDLSLAEAQRIRRETLKKIVCYLGDSVFVLLPIN